MRLPYSLAVPRGKRRARSRGWGGGGANQNTREKGGNKSTNRGGHPDQGRERHAPTRGWREREREEREEEAGKERRLPRACFCGCSPLGALSTRRHLRRPSAGREGARRCSGACERFRAERAFRGGLKSRATWSPQGPALGENGGISHGGHVPCPTIANSTIIRASRRRKRQGARSAS